MLVRGHVGELLHLTQTINDLRCPDIEFVQIGVGQGVLILRTCQTTAHVDILAGLHEQVHTLNLGHLRTQTRNDFAGIGLTPLGFGFECDIKITRIERACPCIGGEACDIGIAAHHIG